MKRKILVFVLILVSCSVVAQDQFKAMRFSLIGSPHVSWIKSDITNNATESVFLGYYFGLEFDYFFESNYGFSSGISLERTGGSLTFTDQQAIHFNVGTDSISPGTTLTFQLNYLDIPLGLKFTSTEVGYTTIFADVGLNFLINTKATASATDNNYDKEPITDEISMFNLAYHLEAGILYSLGNNMSLILALEYRNSFLDLTKDLGAAIADHASIKQVGLKVGLAF
jgi:opacity protein-like surface antigen